MVLTPYFNLKEKILMDKAVEVKDEKGMQSMFGKPDRRDGAVDGQVQSEYPAHMMNAQIDNLDNEINELSSDLNGGRIPGGDIFEAKEELALLQGRFDEIVISKPNYSISEEKFLHEELLRMNSDMADTLYSRYDQQKGKGSIARPQQEADLNDKPCIKINSEIAKICNIPGVVKGKVSRNGIDKARKILCHYFGRDDASREAIRPENNTARKRPMVGYTNVAFAKAHERIFGKKSGFDPNKLSKNDVEDTPESIQADINALQMKIAKLNAGGEVRGVINTIKTEKETPERETRTDKQYICLEVECGFIGKLTQKGAHIRMHNKQKEIVKNLEKQEG